MKRPKPIIIGPRLKRGKKRKSKPREIEKPIHVSILSYLRVTLLQGCVRVGPILSLSLGNTLDRLFSQ